MLNFLFLNIKLITLGTFNTLSLWLAASLISLLAGSLLGVFRCSQLKFKIIKTILNFTTFILRGIPYYVQLLIAYFVLPDLLGINISATTAAIYSLGLCSASYMSQIVKSGINSIPIGQWEAAKTLGFSTIQTLRHIIFPQFLKNALPAICGELDQLLKSTSIIASIGVLELTKAGMNIISRNMNPIPVYISIALIYLTLSTLLSLTSNFLEKRTTTW